jgi:DNA (cytosine-5)-methyltransferase 1
VNELALFAGAGGGILGGKLLGWRTVCAVEWEPYPASVLVARQNDGLLSAFPIWDDVQTFDGKPWRGIVDVVSGGFPCQDISSAGKGAGIDGERSGMWREMARIIHEVRPRFAFVENSPMLTSRGLGTVLGDLASMGFDARWGVLGAADVGANHQRDRIWIIAERRGHISHAQHNRIRRWKQQQESIKKETTNMAYTSSVGHKFSEYKIQTRGDSTKSSSKNLSDSNVPQQQGGSFPIGIQQKDSFASDSCWWETEPNVGRVADGLASRVDRLKAIGNGQVPLCAAEAWRILSGGA